MASPPLTLLTDAVQRAAARRPDGPAISMAGTELTYGELNRRSDAVASVLFGRGVQRGDRIGLYAHKSVELLVAMWGVMKAGAAYVPINPDAPLAYVQDLLVECGITHLVTGESKRRVVAELAAQGALRTCMGLERNGTPLDALCVPWSDALAGADEPPAIALTGDDLAYIIFTSGSTGRPKGIMHSHRTALAYAEVASATFGFVPEDRITNHAPLNFDLSTLELFAGAVAGATVVVVSEAHARLPASFAQLLEDERVTVINAVPFALVQLVHRGAPDDRDLSAVRWVLFGGEVFPTRDLRTLMERLPSAQFGNVYGPAEVNGCTYRIVPELDTDRTEPISIGTLYDGMEAMVVDRDDRAVERGTVGELLIRSPAHMLGYWRQPDLTERSRLRRNGEVWYRTGDLVWVDDEGLLRLVGRRDRQVKSRGNRVELDEVETVLGTHPGVEQAVVFAVPDSDGSQRIEAVVVLFDDSAPSPSEGDLRRHVANHLPRYAVPRQVRIVATIPRTSSGKPDRVTLATEAAGTSLPGGGHG